MAELITFFRTKQFSLVVGFENSTEILIMRNAKIVAVKLIAMIARSHCTIIKVPVGNQPPEKIHRTILKVIKLTSSSEQSKLSAVPSPTR